MKDQSKTIKFEFVCSKCEYNNSVEYSWPEKVYEKMGYEFTSYCSECLKENKVLYTETESKELDAEQTGQEHQDSETQTNGSTESWNDEAQSPDEQETKSEEEV